MKVMFVSTLSIAAAATAAFALYGKPSAPPQVDVSVNQENAVQLEVVEKQWTCPTCSDNEKYVLKQLQENTQITDRNALATILGNIKQESMFHPNICEGGARVPYDSCHSGGYGLIQWTSTGRYLGLGSFCKKYDCDPNENIFQRYLPEFEGSGRTVRQYMVPAYYWLGWGIKGNREIYAYDYTKKFVFS
jgi:hypothetical protein